MFRYNFLLILAFSSYTVAICSTPGKIDSLNHKAEEMLNNKTDSAIILSQEALFQSEELNYPEGQSKALSLLCFGYYVQGDYDLAMKCCSESIQISENQPGLAGAMLAYHAMGLINIKQGKNDEAIQILLRLTEMATNTNNLHQLADACSNLGLAYLNKKFYQRSRDYYLSALRLYENIEHSHGEAFCYLNYGRLFFEQNEYDSAGYYFEKSVKLGKELDNERVMLHTYSMMGQVEINQKRFELAEFYFSKAYNLAISHDLLWEKANLSSWLSETNFYAGNYEKAIQYGSIAIELAKKAHIIYILQKMSNTLAKSFLQLNNVKEAEIHVRYLEHLIDSLALADSTDLLRSLIDINLLTEEEQNYQFVNSQLAIARAEISKRNIFLAGTIITILLILIILALIVRSSHFKTISNERLQKLNEEIKNQKASLEDVNIKLDQINREKDLLIGVVAHDMRSPLNTISGLVNILDYETNKAKELEEIFRKIRQTITNAQRLADELLEISRIESGTVTKNYEQFLLSDFITELKNQFDPIAAKKHITILAENNVGELELTADSKMLHRMLENLLSNAIKFSGDNSRVTIICDTDHDKIKISIKDQGAGIPEHEQNLLFTKFGKTSVRPTNGESSNGLGLYIVDQLARANGGKAFFTSEIGKGSIFGIEMPVHRPSV